MPTTNEENNVIFNIISKYLNINDLNECLEELIEKVAYNTDNYSVRKSIYTLYKLIYTNWSPPGYINLSLEARYNKLLSIKSDLISNIDKQAFLGLDDKEYNKFIDLINSIEY